MAEPSSRTLALIPGGLALMLLIMGGVCGFIGRYETKKDAAMLTWPSTTATVKGAHVRTYRNSNDGHEQQSAVTSYEYVVNGRTYDFAFEQYIGNGHSADDSMLPHKANDTVPIYFNPNDPQDESLTRDRGVSGKIFYLLLLGLAILSLPLWYIALRVGFPKAPTPSQP